MKGALALVGSGEYLPIMQDFENLLMQNAIKAGKANRYIQIPTAAGREGPDRIKFWQELGAKQAIRMGAEQVFLPIFDRSAAMDQVIADEIANAGLIYLSGGDPNYLAQTLIDTPVWKAIENAWQSGSSLAGCSAGAMAMGRHVPNFFHPKNSGDAGFAIIGEIRTIPHYNKFFKWIPDSAARMLLTAPPGTSVVGIDEATAIVTGLSDEREVNFENHKWRVHGLGKVHLLRPSVESAKQFSAGQILTL